MNFRKLITYLTMGTAAAMPLAVAQNPTILQGSYISNVFGNSNFVLNPNAQTNVANVTNATRSTTTPLVATSEFTLSLASGANATWTLRAFDGGMKGQNCEARFTYRGFATATTKAEIVQNSLVVASLTLTPTTDPRIASINFPCGDLANLTTFRIAQTTANMTGTNEIGGIYVGLATNMANVAQAENVVFAYRASTQSIPTGTDTKVEFDTETLDVYGEFTTSGADIGVFTAKRAGNYQVTANALFALDSWTANKEIYFVVKKNGSAICATTKRIEATITAYFMPLPITCNIPVAVGDKLRADIYQDNGTSRNLFGGQPYTTFQVSRFPSSSELVVTPERQNVWGSIDGTGLDSTTSSTSYVTPTGFSISGTKGKCLADGTNLACKISTLPPGTYKVDVTMPYFAVAGSAAQNCYVQITDNKGAVDAATAQAGNAGAGLNDGISHVSRTFTYTSVQTDIIFTLKHKQAAGTGGSCGIYTASGPRYWVMNVTPLDQPSNSALYVEGPVKASATGAAIPSGYAGENLSNLVGYNTMTSNAYNALGTRTLTDGVYLVSAQVGWLRNAATFTGALGVVAVSTNTRGYSTGSRGYTSTVFDILNYDEGEGSIGVPAFIVRVQSGTMYFPDGSTSVGDTTLKVAFYPGTFTGGPITAQGLLTVLRIN